MFSLKPEVPEFYLWRFLIDARHQGKGYGAEALRQIVEHVRGLGATELLTSAVPGEGSPEPFYRRYGFAPTGQIDDGEVVLRLGL